LGLVGALAQSILGRWVLRLYRLLARLADLDLAGRGDRRLAPDDVDLVLLHEELDAVVHLSGDAAGALDDGSDVEAELVSAEPVVLGVAHLPIDIGRAQQRLRRDAAPVGADAGHVLALDNGGLHAELGSTDGGDVAAGSGADDDEIVCVSHVYSFTISSQFPPAGPPGKGTRGRSARTEKPWRR